VNKKESNYYHIQTGSGAHPASHPMVSGVLTLGVNWLGHETDNSPPSTAEVKNAWS